MFCAGGSSHSQVVQGKFGTIGKLEKWRWRQPVLQRLLLLLLLLALCEFAFCLFCLYLTCRIRFSIFICPGLPKRSTVLWNQIKGRVIFTAVQSSIQANLVISSDSSTKGKEKKILDKRMP